MKKLFAILMSVLFLFSLSTEANVRTKKNGYVVITSNKIKRDSEWMNVATVLAKRHNATVLFYDKKPAELLDQLKKLTPRYVAIVETPENLNRDYVMEGHQLSRMIDDDIYADYLWGIITGYDAAAAMKMVENSEKPFVIKTAFMTANQLINGRWFDKFAYINDNVLGEWGEKKSPNDNVEKYKIEKNEMLRKWVEKYTEIDPDLVISSAHATEANLEMPYSAGNLKSKGGQLYADFATPEFIKGTTHPRVYYPSGNCLIGNVKNSKESMAIAWMNGGGATSMVGYVVTTWYGRNGWGGLKYFASSFGKLTLAEAVYMNQQDMLRIENEWDLGSTTINYPFALDDFGAEFGQFGKTYFEKFGKKPSMDQIGFAHDRDVVVLYGDPAWDVRMQPASLGYNVTSEIKGKKCIVTIKTDENFDKEMMEGGKIKMEHVSDLPFYYLFPTRLSNPKLTAGQSWDAVLADDFMFIKNSNFEKNKTYKISIDLN